jgi:hypothetical protein
LGDLAALIRRTADELRKTYPDYRDAGLSNALIVQAALAEAERLCAPEYSNAIAALLARMIPSVLPENAEDDRRPAQLMIPGIELDPWFAIFHEEKDGPAGWKLSRDCTPNDIRRMLDHRQADIDGRIAERHKLVIWHQTALDLGCDPNKPVSTVFFPDEDDDRPDPPEDRPRP